MKQKKGGYEATARRFRYAVKTYEKMTKPKERIAYTITAATKAGKAAQMRAFTDRLNREKNKIRAAAWIEKRGRDSSYYRAVWDNYEYNLLSELSGLVSTMEALPYIDRIKANLQDVDDAYDSVTTSGKVKGGRYIEKSSAFHKELVNLSYEATFAYAEARHEALLGRLDQVIDMLNNISVRVGNALKALAKTIADARHSYGEEIDYEEEEF